MKLQIQGQGMRIRIEEAELARLLAGETIEDASRLPGGARFSRSLRLAEASDGAFQCTQEAWAITLPLDEVLAYSRRLPCREGISFAWPAGDAGFSAVLEVDVRDSTRKRITAAKSRQALPAGDIPAV